MFDPNVAAPINGVKFSADDCGTPWGQGTLATTASWSRNGVVTQAGISFNSTFTWNVYDGPYATGVWAGVQDFRRVALHELGHVIGLGHEDSAPSIMSTFVSQGSTIIQPQADDITGVNILYGAPITDSTGPAVVITSHSNGQTVPTTTITLAGTATDSGRGDGGIASVSINGVRANTDTAAGQGTANWREVLTLAPGSNTITVVATDDSQVHNTTTTSITINVAVSTSVTSSAYHVFPQFADGKLPDGTFYRTTLMIENSTNSATNCTFQFFSRSSSASNFTVPLTVGPGGWLISPSAGTADFQAGHATLQCSANVEAQLLYSFYSSTGVKLSEATVFSSPSSGAVKIIVDQRQGSQLGLAIANDTDRVITYTIALSDGATSGVLTLFPKSSVAKFLNELLPGVPGDFLGQVVVYSSNGSASAVGLRYSGPNFTTIPETFAGSPGPTASTYHIFPQYADGRFSDGSFYRTTRAYTNPSVSQTTACTTRLRLGAGGNNTLTATLQPGAAVIATSDGTQTFQQGYATLECSFSVDSQILYSYYAANGVKLGEATVFSSPAASTVQVLADSREGAQLGLAIANDSDQANTYTIAVYDAAGTLVGSTNRTIAARTSIAAFVNELVPLPPNHYGPVIVSSTTGKASVIGLRFTGTTFTTIPEVIK